MGYTLFFFRCKKKNNNNKKKYCLDSLFLNYLQSLFGQSFKLSSVVVTFLCCLLFIPTLSQYLNNI